MCWGDLRNKALTDTGYLFIAIRDAEEVDDALLSRLNTTAIFMSCAVLHVVATG